MASIPASVGRVSPRVFREKSGAEFADSIETPVPWSSDRSSIHLVRERFS